MVFGTTLNSKTSRQVQSIQVSESSAELRIQMKCFNKSLTDHELEEIKAVIKKANPQSATEAGIAERGFIILNKFFCEKARHETVWTILRAFHYTDNLSLKDSFLYPK